jgi:diguanylate cyclase (GGDEF)-like protein
MKLSKRIWLSIVPVLVGSYLLALVGTYFLEKQSYLSNEKTRLEMQLSNLFSLYILYDSVIDTYLLSFTSYDLLGPILNEKDGMFSVSVVEESIDRSIENLNSVDYDILTFMVIESNNNVKYFYDQSDDPFSEPDGKVLRVVDKMFADKSTNLDTVFTEEDKTVGLRVKILNPLTMKAPISHEWENAVAIVLLMDLKNLDVLMSDLSSDYKVLVSKSDDFSYVDTSNSAVYASKKLSSVFSIYLEYDPALIELQLRELLYKAALAVFILTLISSVLLISLIKRYVTKPIQNLEKNITDVNEKGKEFPRPRDDDDDEINALNRSFYNLYGQLQSSYEKTKVLAEVDALTQLSNRRMFIAHLESLIDRGCQNVSVMFIDLDNFKFVNDNFGHDAGDSVLTTFAERLQSVIRLTDLVVGNIDDEAGVSRLAGDEFAVALNDSSSETDVNKLGLRILSIFENGFDCPAGHFPVSASIGIAAFPRDGATAEELIVSADAAMYQSKNSGKNQMSFYSSELAAITRRELLIEQRLKEQDFSEFSMYYMPVVDAKTSKVVGVEALIRWFSEDLGFVSPDEFIPIAESRGLFQELDLWVVEKVMHDVPALHQLYGENCKVAINISSAQLGSENFFLRLMQVIQGIDVSREHLELEITETFSAVMSAQVEANLNLFKQAGFSLALDDFGAGHTSLLQLLDYPLDVIKIDKSVVDRAFTGGADLLNGLINFCKSQGYSITAEGVETKEQVDFLIQAGADTLQGFYFAKPQSLQDLSKNH